MNGVLESRSAHCRSIGEQREFVRTIESSGQNLLAIINDILDFSKIEAGAMTLENIPFDLSDAIEEVVAPWRKQGRAEGP